MSLLYYPFWIREGAEPAVWDGVTGDPETLGTPGELPAAMPTGAFDQLRVLELTCQACGAGLPEGNNSVVLPCTGCGAFWLVTRDGLQRFSAGYARPAVPTLPADRLFWLPFWRLPVSLRYAGKPAGRVRDIRDVLGVLQPPGQLPAEPADGPLTYFVPAYGALQAPRVDHAARDMTRLQPLLQQGEQGRGELFHCFFGPEDARALAYVTWILILPGTVPHRLRSLRIQPGDPALWYVPFRDHGRELVNLLTGLRYDRATFRGVRH